jgi:hypothetical protein
MPIEFGVYHKPKTKSDRLVKPIRADLLRAANKPRPRRPRMALDFPFQRADGPEWTAFYNAWRRLCPKGVEFLFTSFERFLQEVGPRPAGHFVLDHTGGSFGPGTVRWATRSEQIERLRKGNQ